MNEHINKSFVDEFMKIGDHKVSQASVNYRNATEERTDQYCHNCEYFVAVNDSCQKVVGHIDPDDTCDLWDAI